MTERINRRSAFYLAAPVLIAPFLLVPFANNSAFANSHDPSVLVPCPSGNRPTIMEEWSNSDIVFRGKITEILFTPQEQIVNVIGLDTSPLNAVLITGRSDSDIVFSYKSPAIYHIYAKNATAEFGDRFGGSKVYWVRPCTNTTLDQYHHFHGLVVGFLTKDGDSDGIAFKANQFLNNQEYSVYGRTSQPVQVNDMSIMPGSNVTLTYALAGQNGILEVSLPKTIIDGISDVKLNSDHGFVDAVVEENISNSTHTTIAVRTPLSTNAVVFSGSHVLPEFGSMTFLLILTSSIAALLIVVRYLPVAYQNRK